jgi:hypothetical protein
MDATLTLNIQPPAGTPSGSVPTAQGDGSVAWTQAPSIQHANTGNMAELVTGIVVNPATFTVVLSIPVGPVLAGDLFLANGEVQVTNDLGYNCMVTGYLVLADAPDKTAGIEVSENNGTNVTPAQHHLVVPKAGTYQADKNYGERWLQFVCRAASTASQAGDVLTVDQDYGRLSVVRVRGATAL